MKVKYLLESLKPLYSEDMEKHTKDFPDETNVAIEVSGRNGYRLNITLGELRTFWAEYRYTTKKI